MLHDTGANGGTPVQIGKLIYNKLAVSVSARETVISNEIILKRVGMRCRIFEGRIMVN